MIDLKKLMLDIHNALPEGSQFVLTVIDPEGGPGNVAHYGTLAPHQSLELFSWLSENWQPVEADNFLVDVSQ